MDGDSFRMRFYENATFLIAFGTLTGDAVLKFYAGATNGAKTTAIPFKYRLASAVQGNATDADAFGSESQAVAADGLTLTAATYQNKHLVVEVNAFDMDANSGQAWLTMELNAAALAILSTARVRAGNMPKATE
ncbi:MAG: hypothetical protein L0177_06210 [Chloroflexi bacterium]|nr:hypothetical protein [Chloroflexota bacterium]